MRKQYLSVLPAVFLFLPLFGNLFFLFPGGAPSPASGLMTGIVAAPAEKTYETPIQPELTEARRLLEKATGGGANAVTLAARDPRSGAISLLTLPKTTFLTEGAVAAVTSSSGAALNLRVVRSNYVNTAVEITDSAGRALAPLMVRYPIEKGGSISEVAYYTSAHPAIESPETIRAGRAYIEGVLDAAADRLAARGDRIDPAVVDIAEHLCVVEHTDHRRFETENHGALFDEIDSIYALNHAAAYGYSVSSAGAGGMIQMIPRTYQAIRQMHPEAALAPDFVAGMRDHANAASAMLLYMQDTWNRLATEPEVKAALDSGTATEAELLAAGYNSNPLRLSSYLARGATAWRTLIPSETQMYLQIYAAVDAHNESKQA